MAELIGRAAEASAIARFAERVPDGPVGLLIEGEAGIGKTTVWSTMVELARAQGHRVLVARPAEAEADLSFAALGDLIGEVFDEVSGGLPPPQRHALEVALLRQEADAAAQPRTTAGALLGVLAVLATDRPLVVAIDDAQWIDAASERALRFAARRLPPRTGIAVASRTRHEAGATLGLDRALDPDRLEHLVLGPLSLATLHQLIERRLAIKLARPVLVRVAEVSRGNPFHALEIANAISQGGEVPALSDPLPVPRNLRELVSARVRRLSVSARAALLAAAALSHPTATSVAAALGPGFDAEAALLEAEEAGILIGHGERLGFSHPLLASAISEAATQGQLRALHQRLAEVVSDREERARHLARSVVGTSDAAATAIEEAAGLAQRRGAPEAAAELYESATRLTPSGRRDDLARRMLGAANALWVAGDLDGARSLANQVLNTGLDGSTRVRALLLLGSIASYAGSNDARIEYLERALIEAGQDPALRVTILLAMFEEIGANPVIAAGRADEAIELLRDRDDPASMAQALMDKFIAEAILGRGARAELLDEALALEARGSGQPLVYPLIWFHWIDDLDATRARYRLGNEAFRDLGDIVGAAELAEFIAMAEFRAGRWDWAEQALEEACATLAQVELRGPVTASFTDRSVIDAHRGRIERGRATLTGIIDGVDRLDLVWRMVCHSAQGSVEFCAGSYDAADRAWTAMRDEAAQIGWIDVLEDRSEPDHVEALLGLGRPADARRVLEHLEWRGRTLPRPWIDATLPRARALILAAEGQAAAALAALDSAPEVAALPFERARTLLVRGQIQRRANRKLAARESLAESLAMFERLGSPPWVNRARAEIARLGLRHRGPNELTASEHRIAELAASGLTNRQVAEAAFVSPKTVEANLARIYQKLGIRSRAELGARMSTRAGGAESQT